MYTCPCICSTQCLTDVRWSRMRCCTYLLSFSASREKTVNKQVKGRLGPTCILDKAEQPVLNFTELCISSLYNQSCSLWRQ